MNNYDYLAKIYTFASENGYKVKDLNVGERRNQRGRYDFVELTFIIPRCEDRPLETVVNELESEIAEGNPETSADNTETTTTEPEERLEEDHEVNNNEI